MKLQCIILIFNRKFDKFTAELHPVPITSDVWHTIGMDLIGPLPTTPRGNKYIMTVSCYFSKYEICKLTGVKSKITSVYHPQTNGLDERFNQTLQRQLIKVIKDEQDQWDLFWMLFYFPIEYLGKTP